jgi:hypothetical protein
MNCRLLTRLSVPVLFVLLLAGCKGYELEKKNYADEPIQWGEPVNGLKVGIARREYNSGFAPAGRDMIYFVVHLMNVTGRNLSILAPTAIAGSLPEDLAGDESVGVTLVYDTGAGATRTGEFRPKKKPPVQVMEPNKAYLLELRVAPEKFGLQRFVPGSVSAVYANRQTSIRYKNQGDQTVGGLWAGEARSGTIVLRAATQPSTQPAAAK